jgi:hypothetical protein
MRQITKLAVNDPELAALACAMKGTRLYARLPAPPGLVAVSLIGGLAGDPYTGDWSSRCVRLWHCLPADPAWHPELSLMPRDPIVTGNVTPFGRVLTVCLSRPVLARRIVRIELSKVAAAWNVYYRAHQAPHDVRAALYTPLIGTALRAAMVSIAAGAVTAIRGAVIQELAELIAPDL